VAFRVDQSSGWWTILGTLAFGLQIYTDFLGYSMIAKGVALLLGFELKWNFAHPYWAKSLKEFWAGWHVTLSRWLRDYLYIPLGGNRGGGFSAPRNIIITMALGGLWHGANWTFIAWGGIHGIALAIFHSFSKRQPEGLNKYLGWFLTMCVVYLGWFLFRARNLSEIKVMTLALRNFEWYPAHLTAVISLIFLYSIVFLYEYFERRTGDRYALLRLNPWVSSFFYASALFLTLIYSSRAGSSFIYFQF
jgi:D-alanyl-lipoteichoic acid acyltransferase DltB (MBOAT superfamily)